MARLIQVSSSEIFRYQLPQQKQHSLSIVPKMILGALGALTPVLLNLYAVDFEKLFMHQQITVPYVIGYVVRILILILYGSLIAFFHRDENNPVKLFQLGVAFPAIVTILLSGASSRNGSDNTTPSLSTDIVTPTTNAVAAVPVLAARADVARADVARAMFAQYTNPSLSSSPPLPKQFDMVQENALSQFVKGFLGTQVQSDTFVVALTPPQSLARATDDYQFYQRNYPNADVQLYRAYQTDDLYVLVLGGQMSKTAAISQQNTAQRMGLHQAALVDLRTVMD